MLENDCTVIEPDKEVYLSYVNITEIWKHLNRSVLGEPVQTCSRLDYENTPCFWTYWWNLTESIYSPSIHVTKFSCSFQHVVVEVDIGNKVIERFEASRSEFMTYAMKNVGDNFNLYFCSLISLFLLPCLSLSIYRITDSFYRLNLRRQLMTFDSTLLHCDNACIPSYMLKYILPNPTTSNARRGSLLAVQLWSLD